MPNAIVIKNLRKKYKLYKEPLDRLKEALHPFNKSYHHDFLANDNISFEIKKGEVVGIIGKNGSGKSTLLKMITGVLTPSSGSIEVNGKITAMLELGAGFNPELNGMENLYMSGAINGFSKDIMQTKIDEIVKFADIGVYIHQPLKTYSSGMKARLGFAFSINIEPEILIIDEALSVGDAAFQRKCYSKIESMCQNEAITVLFVSHSGGVIKQLCSRAIMLYSGQKVIDGNPKNVVNLYEKFGDRKNISLDTIRAEYQKLILKSVNQTKKSNFTSCYNPNIISKSKVEHEQNGARIFDIKMTDSDGNECNILEKNQYYIFRYKIQYFNSYERVKINMRVKDIKGIRITGYGNFFNNIKKDKIYNFTIKFENILNSGEYFLSCGTIDTKYDQNIQLHRIVDAYMIKVINSNEKEESSKGFVDFKFDVTLD